MKEEELTIEDAKTENIWAALKDSRNEPVVSLQNIAEICGKVFNVVELEIFIIRLKEVLSDK